ncbi:hypothetical protein [Aquirufa rosea]|uniref:Outer membrane protein beta-barrel domain-containing protein n=1 Tax=Aquirufa rosea TaxID=2509241 RepID=A0A4Q1C033_9BACT|nr:hypothetical protein [Aquirufa rosea]RXK49697.1 hypothetical protein ESB04_05845 [Aquirufa rosea]
MKQLLLLVFLICVGGALESRAQDPVVIKEDGAKGDLDVEPDVSELSFRQRLHFGGGLSGLSFGNPTSIGVSPMVGYSLANNTIVGLGVSYQYYSVNYGGSIGKITSNLLGERVFIRQYIPTLTALLGQSYLVGQVENYSNLSQSNNIYNLGYSNPVLVGIGIGSKLGINLSVMYDLNYSSSSGKVSPYGSALVVQVGGFFF